MWNPVESATPANSPGADGLPRTGKCAAEIFGWSGLVNATMK